MAASKTGSSAGVAKKICPSCETEFPGRFNHCPGCGIKVEGETAKPDPEGTAFLDERIRSGVRSVLEETGLAKKAAKPTLKPQADPEDDSGDWEW